MNSNIKLVNLQDYCDKIQYGYTQSASVEKVGPKFLRITDIQIKPIKWNEVPYCVIIEKDYKKYKLENGDIVIARTGASTGRNAIYSEGMPDAVFASYLIRIKMKKEFIPKYVYYYLQSQKYSNHIYSIIGGSAQPNANAKELTNVLIPLHDINVQTKIVELLSSLDDKIEINISLNSILEDLGAAIFRRWFVEFEFPDEDGKPYHRNRGPMKQITKGSIPQKWKIMKIKDCGKVITGKTPSTRIKEYYDNDVPFIKIPDMREQIIIAKTARKLSKLGANSQKKKELPPLSVCVSCIATPGLVSLTSEISHTNQQINSIICNENISPFFIYFYMKEKSNEIIQLGSGGTATLNLNKGNFEKIDVIIPENKIMIEFHNIMKPIINSILNNYKENEILGNIRDVLLPHLMSGKIRLNL